MCKKLPQNLSNHLRFRILGNKEILSNCLKNLELIASSESATQKPYVDSCTKNCKNPAVKHSKETPTLLDFVNLSIFCSKF